MKKFNLLSLLFLSITLTTFAQQLEVEGAIQSDSLTGTNSRLVQTNSTGEMNDVAEGNLGEFLSQGNTGVEWSSMPVNSNPCTPINECPTEFSTSSASTMIYADCLRYCENLSEDGNEDWRTPSMNEIYSLIGKVPSESIDIWSVDLAFYETYRNTTQTKEPPLRVSISFSSGSISYSAHNVLINCKCVR